MTESEFIAAAEAVFQRIDQALENSDIDVSLNEGVLELELEDGAKIIISRHVPNREIWLAAKSGGFHFRWNGALWQDTRSGEEFFSQLTRCQQQAGAGGVAF